MISASDSFERGLRDFKEKLRAETSAAYSDIPRPDEDREITIYKVKSTQAISILVFSLLWELAFWQTEKLYRTLSHLAYAHNYQGHWSTLQLLLENEDQHFEAVVRRLCEIKGTHATFGLLKDNLVPHRGRTKPKIFYCFVIKDRNLESKSRPKYPQRKRGYADKGSCRRPHEYHGDPPLRDREDRRHLVHHPLLEEMRNWKGKDFYSSGCPPAIFPERRQ